MMELAGVLPQKVTSWADMEMGNEEVEATQDFKSGFYFVFGTACRLLFVLIKKYT